MIGRDNSTIFTSTFNTAWKANYATLYYWDYSDIDPDYVQMKYQTPLQFAMWQIDNKPFHQQFDVMGPVCCVEAGESLCKSIYETQSRGFVFKCESTLGIP